MVKWIVRFAHRLLAAVLPFTVRTFCYYNLCLQVHQMRRAGLSFQEIVDRLTDPAAKERGAGVAVVDVAAIYRHTGHLLIHNTAFRVQAILLSIAVISLPISVVRDLVDHLVSVWRFVKSMIVRPCL